MLSVRCRTRHRRLGDGPSSHFDDLSACRQSYSFLAELPVGSRRSSSSLLDLGYPQ